MKKINSIFLITIFIILASACSINRQVAIINSGNNSGSININDTTGYIDNSTDYQTFGIYKDENAYIVEPSNLISFELTQKERVKNSWKWKKRGKNQYAFVDVDKYFYEFKPCRPIISIIAIPFSFGTSLTFMSPHIKKETVSKRISKKELIDRTLYKEKILIETRIWCKRDEINENVIIVENLPDGITVNDYKIKEKRGKSRIDKIDYQIKTIEGEKCHVFTVIPKDDSFKKKNKIWVILDVTIKPEKKHLIE